MTLFDRLAGVYHAVLPPARSEPLVAGLRFADRPVEQLLDVAGGGGRAGRTVATDRDVIVCDAARNMVARAATNELTAVQGDARRLPVSSDAVDAAIIVDALHHVPQPATALADCLRVVAPGGVVVVREFDPETVAGRLLAEAERAVGMDSAFLEPSAVVDALEAAGARAYRLDDNWSYTVVGVVPRPASRNPGD